MVNLSSKVLKAASEVAIEIEELTRRMRSDSKAGMKAAALEGLLGNFAKAILEQADEKPSTVSE